MLIAICDDDDIIIRSLRSKISDYLSKTGCSYEIDIYSCGEQLLSGLTSTEYDVIFLDIEMPSINGVKVAEEIRLRQQNLYIQIVFVSSHMNYLYEVINTIPSGFLKKPIQDEELHIVLDRVQKLLAVRNTSCLNFVMNRCNYRIELNKIYYLESRNRKVVVHTISGNYEFYGKLETVMGNLHNFGFIMVHKSYAVNDQAIVSFTKNLVTLIDGTVLPMSEKYRVLCTQEK